MVVAISSDNGTSGSAGQQPSCCPSLALCIATPDAALAFYKWQHYFQV